MRKRDKILLWPIYFDSTKTRSEGRKVPKKIATPKPKLEEIKKAAEILNFQPEIISNAIHPSSSWLKIGVITISKRESKNKIIRNIAQKILEVQKKQEI